MKEEGFSNALIAKYLGIFEAEVKKMLNDIISNFRTSFCGKLKL